MTLSVALGSASIWDQNILLTLRLPRTITGIAVGGGLAVTGTAIQAVLMNPLADPYIMGIASAGALGAVIGSLFHNVNPFWGSISLSFTFSLASLFILVLWLRSGFQNTRELLLAGVVAGFFFSSLSTLVMAMADPAAWTTSLSWLLGSLGHIGLEQSLIALFANVVLAIIIWFHSKPLDILSIDQELALSSGIDIEAVRKRVFILTALTTAICVSVAGVIGFVGLLVPHAFRFLGASSQRLLIPLCFIGGAGLLTASDAVARVIARPSEIPVGVVMSLVGGPIFIFMIKRFR